MDAKTWDSSRAIVLLHDIMPALPTPAAKDKYEGEKGWRGERSTTGRLKVWKELSSKTLGTRTPTKVCMAEKQPCKTENEHGKYFFSLWKHKKDREGWSIVVFLATKHGKRPSVYLPTKAEHKSEELIQQASTATSPLWKHQHSPLLSPSNFPHTPDQTCPLTTLATHLAAAQLMDTGRAKESLSYQAQISLVMSHSLHINLLHKHMWATLHCSVLLSCTKGKSKQDPQPWLHQQLHWQTEWVFKVENCSFSTED